MASSASTTSSPRPLHVALFEPQPLYLAGMRAALARGFERDLHVVASPGAFDAQAAAALGVQPDVLVLGLATAHDVIPTLETVRRVLPPDRRRPRVLVVAPGGVPATMQRALSLADAFILRTAAPDELPCAIREVRQGRPWLSPAVHAELGRHAAAQRASPLTRRELTIVRLIALGHHNREIAHDLGLSVRTVESHRAHALDKLHLTSRSQLVHWALRHHVI